MVRCEAIGWTSFSARHATSGWKQQSETNRCRPAWTVCGPASRRAAPRTSYGRRSTAGAATDRVVGTAGVTGGEANPPRFVRHLADIPEVAAQRLYEVVYCARGEMENRIKECQLDLFADRTSAALPTELNLSTCCRLVIRFDRIRRMSAYEAPLSCGRSSAKDDNPPVP